MVFIKREYVCPYCFEKHKIDHVKFRCTNNDKLKEDPVYTKYWKSTMPMPEVIEPDTKKGALSWLKPTMPSSAICECGKHTTTRICPTCHSNLPTTISDYEDYIIAVIGAKQSGKSHYVGVLIDIIQNKIGNAYNTYLKPENGETIDRYNRQFKDPLFKYKTTLDVTQSASGNKETKRPLLYTLSFSGEGLLGTKVITLSFFDSAGEDQKSEESMFDNLSYISNSAGVIYLVDPLQLTGVREQIEQQNLDVYLPHQSHENDVVDILDRLTNMIKSKLRLKASKKIDIPIAMSFSKIDVIKPLLDSSSKLYQESRHTDQKVFDVVDFQGLNSEMKALVQGWTRGNVTNLLDIHYKDYAFFGLSALGKDPGTSNRIEKIEPYRVEDPFLWLLWKNGIIKGHERK